MKTNKKQEDETRKCFATLQEARDFCNINDRRIDPLGNVNWMRCSPNLPKYVKELEDRITELEIQEAGWFRAASMLRIGMGLADGSDLRECLLTFNQLRDKLDHAGKCNNAE